MTSTFSQATQAWLRETFEKPTRVQERAWQAIAKHKHTLICAPTGSGKTLAAFLHGIDQLLQNPTDPHDRHVRILYVSPLKALSVDIERNLRVPLAGIAGANHITVGVRTGDTPSQQRSAMRRKPPDILITTPESLYLMLTSQAQEILRRVETVIVDEIHAVAPTKRGTHLALTLERLTALAKDSEKPQRVGLSATQKPLARIAQFLAGTGRQYEIVDASEPPAIDVHIHVPVESMVEPEQSIPISDAADLQPLGGMESIRKSIWPAIYPELLKLVREHTSTILFVNDRRSAERVALRLNELFNAENPDGDEQLIARAHHGSLAHEERLLVEEQLKAGELPCLVATSSLELGIDMGAVDLVIQLQSPKSVSRGLQRIGRAGHHVGDISRGRIFPKFRADLLECAVIVNRMKAGEVEATTIPQNPLDVLAQQLVGTVAARKQVWNVEKLYQLVRGAYPYAELPRSLFDAVLDMLDGRYPSQEFAEFRARIIWDRETGTVQARKGAHRLAVLNGGTIPDRGLYTVVLPDGRRVGELDEEMVYETRPGQVILLGATTWRVQEVGRDRVTVTPAPGMLGSVPFWRGDGFGRPKELGKAIGEFARFALEQPPQALMRDFDLDRFAAQNLIDFLQQQQQATRVLPSDKVIVVERFRDEVGDWRLCVLSPYGGRVHGAWGLALSGRVRERYGLEADVIWSDDGIIIHLPDTDEPPGVELVRFAADELEEQLIRELDTSAMFSARFRENAGRSLLIPRAYPGKRTPLWQQRLKSQTLLEIAKRYSQFPLLLETYRECLQDILDVPATVELLRDIQQNEIALVEVETTNASPFATSLLFDYVAFYMYELDAPNAERQAAALTLDRDLLRELLGQAALRDLINRDVLQAVEDRLQRKAAKLRARSAHDLLDLLRQIGDLTELELAERSDGELDISAALAQLEEQHHLTQVEIAGQKRWIACQDAGLYRDALGIKISKQLPAVYLEPVEDSLLQLVIRYGATRGPFTKAQVKERFAVDVSAVLRQLEGDGRLVCGELHPDGVEREWCTPEVLRRLRRESVAALRKTIQPVPAETFAGFLPKWQHVDSSVSGAGVERLRDVLAGLQGIALPISVWENDVLPRRLGSYSPHWLDELCTSGEIVWLGGGARDRVALYFREDVHVFANFYHQPYSQEDNQEAIVVQLRECLKEGAAFFTDLLAQLPFAADLLQQALWQLIWKGEVTNDAVAPLRALKRPTQRQQHANGYRRAQRRKRGFFDPVWQGRWSLTDPFFQPFVDEGQCERALAELLLDRYGIVTREHVRSEKIIGGFARLYKTFSDLETLGVCQRGYFIEGLGAAQFASAAAVERLRQVDAAHEQTTCVLHTLDPAQVYGATLTLPKTQAAKTAFMRGTNRYLLTIRGLPIWSVEKKQLRSLVNEQHAQLLEQGLVDLVDYVRNGTITLHHLSIEQIDGDSVLRSRFLEVLIQAGCRQTLHGVSISHNTG